MSRIGIIAGKGSLPEKLIAACARNKKSCFVIAIKGQTDAKILKDVPFKWVKLGETSETIKILKEENITSIVMGGAIKRPGIFDLNPDLKTMQIIADVGISSLGDDKLLRAITKELEKEGFKIIGAHEIEPSLLTPKQLLTKAIPSKDNMADIEQGMKVAKGIGALDIGQAVIIQQGVVIGVEAVEGTNELIERYSKLKYERGYSGVLVKASKPNQDVRIDLPTIGPKTVEVAFKAGLAGIAIEANASMILEREKTIEVADKLGMFVIGI